MAGRPKSTTKTASKAEQKRDKTFVLCSGKVPAIEYIRNDFQVRNKNGDFIAYMQGESTILVDEIDKSKVRRVPIAFTEEDGGKLLVRANNRPLMEFLDEHEDNAANGGSLFKEDRPDLQASKNLDYAELLDDARMKFRDLKTKDIDKLSVVATSRGIETKGVKAEMWLWNLRETFVEADPKGFLESLNDSLAECKSIVFRAINEGHIDTSNVGIIRWSVGGGVIMNVPNGKEPDEMLAAYLNTDKGLPLKEEMAGLVGM